MKHYPLAALLAAVSVSSAVAGGPAAAAGLAIIPQPQQVRPTEGVYTLTPQTAILVAAPELQDVGHYLADLLAPATGMKLAVRSPGLFARRGIVLNLEPSRRDLGAEGYTLECTPRGVTITAAQPAGVFYGVQTFRQMLPPAIERRQPAGGVVWAVPCVTIADQPRFRWRGYLLDPARHFRTKAELLQVIDRLALLKLNVLQLHLTDDQGWRVALEKYPKLTAVGARLPDCSGQKGAGWFYTPADLREMVAYAARRQVTIVPEIEMPGHSGAATTAYPELGCGGRSSSALCVSQERTFEYARAALDGVLALFPSPYIHIGGDEVAPSLWRACPQCKAQMERLAGITLPPGVMPVRLPGQNLPGQPYQPDIARLQGEFIRRVDAHLTAQGRRLVGWDEIVEGGLAVDSRAVVMVWRGAAAVANAAAQQRDVVVTLYPDYYLDNTTTLERTYAFEPVPPDLPAGQAQHIVGVQGNMWGEQTPTLQRVDQQTFPRLCAIAETGWTSRAGRNYQEFFTRLTAFQQRLDELGVLYRKP